MCGLDKRWLAKLGVDADDLAGLIPLSPQVITHFTIRDERGIEETQPIIDDLAPLFHVRKDAPPILLVTGDREKGTHGPPRGVCLLLAHDEARRSQGHNAA